MNAKDHNKILIYTADQFYNEEEDIYGQPGIEVIEMNGAEIQTWDDYISAIKEKFNYPITDGCRCPDGELNLDEYIDIMTDLMYDDKLRWGWILVIYNYAHFMRTDDILRGQIMEIFIKNTLPFWQYEVEQVVVEGESKKFDIIIIEDELVRID